MYQYEHWQSFACGSGWIEYHPAAFAWLHFPFPTLTPRALLVEREQIQCLSASSLRDWNSQSSSSSHHYHNACIDQLDCISTDNSFEQGRFMASQSEDQSESCMFRLRECLEYLAHLDSSLAAQKPRHPEERTKGLPGQPGEPSTPERACTRSNCRGSVRLWFEDQIERPQMERLAKTTD